MPFTILYSVFLVLSLDWFSLIIILLSEGINAIVALQSWIFAMNYLKSYLLATKQPSSTVFRTHSFIFWIITITYTLSLILIALMLSFNSSQKTF